MESKKKIITWDENTEPPKNHIWVKADGKAYEYNNGSRRWEESKSFNSSDNSDNMTILEFVKLICSTTNGIAPDVVINNGINVSNDKKSTLNKDNSSLYRFGYKTLLPNTTLGFESLFIDSGKGSTIPQIYLTGCLSSDSRSTIDIDGESYYMYGMEQ